MSKFNKNSWVFKKPDPDKKDPFERLFEIFKELITYTSGDFDEAIEWLRNLDQEYQLTTPEYTIDDFIKDLLERGFIQQKFEGGDGQGDGDSGFDLTAKTENLIRKHAFENLFGKIKAHGRGNHATKKTGQGTEETGDLKSYEFGDPVDKIAVTESIRNAQISSGIGDFTLKQEDLVIPELHHNASMSTVLMIDISHSMILYGEDRITPAKKVAMALAELILTRYPKDTLDIITFGNWAEVIQIKDILKLQVGPYHTNTVAGLELAMDLLRRKKNTNKQIFMITDGKPSCMRLPDGRFYKNSAGLDEFIVQECYKKGLQARKLHIPITTFMIAQDNYLRDFIREFTHINKGKAFFTGLDNLGEMIFEDYEQNRRKRLGK